MGSILNNCIFKIFKTALLFILVFKNNRGIKFVYKILVLTFIIGKESNLLTISKSSSSSSKQNHNISFTRISQSKTLTPLSLVSLIWKPQTYEVNSSSQKSSFVALSLNKWLPYRFVFTIFYVSKSVYVLLFTFQQLV